MIVICGLTPIELGTTDPSATWRPSTPCTCRSPSTTPRSGRASARAVTLARERQRHREVVRWPGGALEHDALARELVDVVRLRHAVRHVDDLVEQRAHGGRRMQREVASELTGGAPQALAGEQQRRDD